MTCLTAVPLLNLVQTICSVGLLRLTWSCITKYLIIYFEVTLICFNRSSTS